MQKKSQKLPQLRPRVFVGSSSEAIWLAKKVSEHLANATQVRPWTEVFDLGTTTVQTLCNELDRADYAVLLATTGDRTSIRGKVFDTPRDNIVFEAGLFMGRLGLRRAFVISDRQLKLPSDLDGLTVATFDHENEESLNEAAEKVLATIERGGNEREVDFLRAYLDFIDPEKIELASTYADILREHYAEIKAKIKDLHHDSDWSALIGVKQRLREYFEYSGQYSDGIEFGYQYAKAMDDLGCPYEANWARMKDVGYLQILAGDYSDGITAINGVLKKKQRWSRHANKHEVARLEFYCYRYLAIANHRDPEIASLSKSRQCLDKAENCIRTLSARSNAHRELFPRLLRNRGHLAMEENDFKGALAFYRRALKRFVTLRDVEHIGITKLAIARAELQSPCTDQTTAHQYLLDAERAFIAIGWLEGQLRVYLELGPLYVSLAASLAAEKLGEILQGAQHTVIQAKGCAEKVAVLNTRLQARSFNTRSTDLERSIKRIEHTIQSLLKKRRTRPDQSTFSSGA